MNNKKNGIICVADNASAYNGFCEFISGWIKRYSNQNINFYIIRDKEIDTNSLKKKYGIDIQNNVKDIYVPIADNILVQLLRRGRRLVGVQYLLYFVERLAIKKSVQLVKKVLNQIDANVIMTNGDRIKIDGICLKVAKKLQLYTVMAPLWAPDTEEACKEGRIIKKQNEVKGKFDQYVLKKMPKWFADDKYCFISPEQALAWKKEGIATVNPFLMGISPNFDLVCTCTKKQTETLQLAQQDEQISAKVVYTSALPDYNIFFSYEKKEEVFDKLKGEYKLDPKRKNVILGVPRYSGFDRFDFPLEGYLNNLELLLKIIESEDINLLLSIHPKDDISLYKRYEKNYNCKIVNEPLSTYIGIADRYISEENTTTIKWAWNLGIPNYVIPKDFSGRKFEEQEFEEINYFINEGKTTKLPSKRETYVDLFDTIKKIVEKKV